MGRCCWSPHWPPPLRLDLGEGGVGRRICLPPPPARLPSPSTLPPHSFDVAARTPSPSTLPPRTVAARMPPVAVEVAASRQEKDERGEERIRSERIRFEGRVAK